MMKTVELVVPCFNEGKMIELFYNTTTEIVSKIAGYEFSFIFVDDGSKDDTLEKIKKIANDNNNVKYISFSRNFGKEAAMYAGLKASVADAVAVIDADLQHPPQLIETMLEAIFEEGYDSCSARRVSREGEPKIRSMFSRLFYKVINKMSEVEIVDGAVDFRMMKREMVDAVCSMSEKQRFSKGIFCWVGFNTKWISFKNVERIAGKSKWSFWSLFKYAVDGIVAFTTTPLKILNFIGIFVSGLSFIFLLVEFIKKLVLGRAVLAGYTSLIMVILFIGGLVITSLGIIGEYLAKMYIEVKGRPVYITKETNIKDLSDKNGK